MVKVIRNILGGFSVLLLIGILVSSAQISPAKALDTDSNVDIKPSMTVTIPSDPVVMNLDPADKPFESKNLNISVGTNNPYGYELIFSAPIGTLTNRATGNTMENLPELAGGYTESTFIANKWGYGVDNGNYKPLNGTATIKTSDVPINEQKTTIKIGAKVDFLQPAGTYDTTLELYTVPEIFTDGGLDGGYMQNMDPMLCTEEPTLRTDSRDGSQYYVQRLEDGKCWMLDNLRLGGDKPIRLTPTDTNISSNWTLPASGTVCFSSSSCTDTSGTSGNGYTRPAINADSKDTINSDDSKNLGNGSHKYGVYYNLCAFSAGEFCKNSSSATGADYSVTLTQDICPAGWRAPNDNDYNRLKNIYPSIVATENNSLHYVLSLPASGIFNGSYISSTNWSSWRPYVQKDSYYPEGYDNNGNPIGSIAYRYRATYYYIYDNIALKNTYMTSYHQGMSVRCVSDAEVTYQAPQVTMDMISTMQQLNELSDEQKEFLVENMSIGKNYTLRDERDNQTYTVAKLRDNNLWMTQNLNLGATDITVDLTNENTNIAGTVTADEFNTWRKTSGSSYSSTDWESGDYGMTTYTSDGFSQGEYIPVSGTDEISGSPYGTLYNYYAASAGTVSGQYNVGRAVSDICPAGWRLPTEGNTSSELGHLATIYYGALMVKSVADGGAGFARAGYFSGNPPINTGTYGNYWSSNISDLFEEYYRSSISETSAGSSNYYSGYRYNGYSVRCIFDPHTDVFKKAGVSTLQQFKNMSMTEKLTLLNSMEENHNYFLVDNRDRRDYTVAKLKDGNLWMTSNLSLGYGGTVWSAVTPTSYAIAGFANLDSTNTNMPEGAAAITAATVKGWLFNRDATTNVSDSYTAGKIALYSSRGYDTISLSEKGMLYNYAAASALTRATATITDDATYDICPAGWRLPTGGPIGELTNLYNKYGSRQAMLTPVNDGGAGIARAGSFYWIDKDSGFIHSDSYYAYLWSSWLKDGTNMAIMRLDTSEVTPDSSYTRNYGASIRCVLKFDMQEFNNLTPAEKTVVLGSMETGKNYVFNDSRDGRSYTVAKLKDGNVWMTENLNLGATAVATTISLNSTNTNIPTNLTVTAATFNGWKKTADATTSTTAGQFRTALKTEDGVNSYTGKQYGTLYNYYAASAGTVNLASNPYDATMDICPAGWRLPTGGDSGEMNNLVKNATYSTNGSSVGYTITYSNGAVFTPSTHVLGAWVNGMSLSGYWAPYWTSTRIDDNSVSIFGSKSQEYYSIDGGGVRILPEPNGRGYRDSGGHIYCILKPVSETIKNGSWWYGQ